MTRNEEQQQQNLISSSFVSAILPKYEICMIGERFLSEFGPMELLCVFPGDVSFADWNIKIHFYSFTVTEACKEELIGT